MITDCSRRKNDLIGTYLCSFSIYGISVFAAPDDFMRMGASLILSTGLMGLYKVPKINIIAKGITSLALSYQTAYRISRFFSVFSVKERLKTQEKELADRIQSQNAKEEVFKIKENKQKYAEENLQRVENEQKLRAFKLEQAEYLFRERQEAFNERERMQAEKEAELRKREEKLYNEESRFNAKRAASEHEKSKSSSHFDFFQGCKNKDSLKQRYHKLMQIYHPDNCEGGKQITQMIQSEYEKRQRA